MTTFWLDAAKRLSAGGPLAPQRGRPGQCRPSTGPQEDCLSNTPLLSGVKHAIHTCIWEMHHASKSSSSLHITSSHALSAAMVYNELESIGGHLSGHNRTFKLESVRSPIMSEVPYCHLAIRADRTMTHGTSDSTNVFEALWATVDSSNGTHGCDCGPCIFVIFESSSHNRNRSGQRSIYSARSSSSTSRNNNRTTCA